DVDTGYYTKQLIDINGDGLPDLVTRASATTYSVRYNTGRGFSASSVTWSGVDDGANGTLAWDGLQGWDGQGTKVQFIDMDGDGLVDRVKRNYTGSTNDFLLVQLSTGPFPDLLSVASNGIGGAVTVTYLPSTAYNNSDGNRSRLPFPVYTV